MNKTNKLITATIVLSTLFIVAFVVIHPITTQAMATAHGGSSCNPTGATPIAFGNTLLINQTSNVILTMLPEGLNSGPTVYNNIIGLQSPQKITWGYAKSIGTGTQFTLGRFDAGELEFFLTNPTGQTVFTGPGSRNPDGNVHAKITSIASNQWQVGFEDETDGCSDWDYDDVSFTVTAVPVQVTPPPPSCTSHASEKCINNNVYWFDSCGTKQELAQTCASSQFCQNAQCTNITTVNPGSYCESNSNPTVDFVNVAGSYPATPVSTTGGVFDTKSVSVSVLPTDVVLTTPYRIGQDTPINSYTDDALDISTSLGNFTQPYYTGCFDGGSVRVPTPINITSLFNNGSQTSSHNVSATFSFRDVCGLSVEHTPYYLDIIHCAPACTSHASQKCNANNVYWYDSCGTQQDVAQACTASQTCQNSQCVNIPNVTPGSFCSNNSNPTVDYVSVSSPYTPVPATQSTQGKVYDTANANATILPTDVVLATSYRLGTDSPVYNYTDDALDIHTSLGNTTQNYYTSCAQAITSPSPINLTSLFNGSETSSHNVNASFSFRDVCGGYIGHTQYYLDIIHCAPACTPNASKKCVGNAVYWFDSCGKQGGLVQTCTANQTCSNAQCVNIPITCTNNTDCGTNVYTGSPFCQGNAVYQNFITYTCNNPGTASSYCSNATNAQKKTDCSTNQTCSNGTCQSINITCSSNSDCGTSCFTGSPFCQGNSVFQNFITYTCNNPGTANSYCSNSTAAQKKNDCTSNQTCANGTCTQNCTQSCGSNPPPTNNCVWLGHCQGDPCQTFDDCDGNLVCNYGKCGPMGQQNPPPTNCTPNWQTGTWSQCSNGQQTRTCTDTNHCGTTSGEPAQTQSCSSNPPPSSNQGMVSFTFDDGWLSAYQNGIPLLDQYGIKSTDYIITSEIGDTANGYITSAQIMDLQSRGHEIEDHTKTHADLTTVSPTQLTDEVAGSKSLLEAMGINPITSIDYPFGSYNSTVEQAVKDAGYVGARTSDDGDNTKGTDPYLLKAMTIESTTTVAQIEQRIDAAVANNTWLVFVIHQVDNLGNQYDISPANLSQVVDYIHQKNVKTVKVSEGLAQMSSLSN